MALVVPGLFNTVFFPLFLHSRCVSLTITRAIPLPPPGFNRMNEFAELDPLRLFGLPSPEFVELDDGLHMPYVSVGEGELMVFVHGSLCDLRYWKPQLEPLSKKYRCVAISLSHYWPTVLQGLDARAFGWDVHVDEVAAFIERLGRGPAHLIGHSRGGCVAFHLAVRYPAWVKSLTLADPGGGVARDAASASARSVSPAPMNALRAKAASLITDGQLDAGLELFVDSVSRPGFWARSPKEFRAMATDNAKTLVLQFQDPLPDYDAATAGRVKCPTVLIDGSTSPRMFRESAGALERWIDGARRVTIEGASHGMNVTHAAAFNRVVGAAG
jgi:pimeloyl-ACP methyl ester carboxylesterase